MLEERLQSSSYWQERFDDFGLSSSHLKMGIFPSEDEVNALAAVPSL